MLLLYIVYLQGFLMLLSDPFAHGSLETPVDVRGKATIKIELNFKAKICLYMLALNNHDVIKWKIS